MADECADIWCVLPPDHRPVHEVLPIPRQIHAASWWVRAAYLAHLTTQDQAA